MFFDYSLLNRRTGKFSLIWLVVNDRIECRRKTDKNYREIMAVNVSKTCEDIIRYICAQVPARGPGSARPRFSLYLSSMLMAGSVRVYHHQACFLLSDAAAAFEKLMKTSYLGGCLEDDPVSVRRVTLTVDPLELVPSGDPFQLGSLYDIDTMLEVGHPMTDLPPGQEPESEGGAEMGAGAAGQQPAVNPNLARSSDITLREEDRSERRQHLLEDFGEPLLPHQRSLLEPQLDPLLELELELAPGQRPAEPSAAAAPPPPAVPPPPGPLSPPGPRPAAAAAGRGEEDEQAPAERQRASEPVQHLLLSAEARAAPPPPAGDAADGAPLLGDLGDMPPPPPPPPPAEGEQPQRAAPRRRTGRGERPPPEAEDGPPPPAPEDTTLPGGAGPPADLQPEPQVTPQRAADGAVPPAERPSRRRAPPAADITIEEPPPPRQAPAGSQGRSDVSSSLQLPEPEPVAAPAARPGRHRRRLAVDSAIQLDREALRRRIDEGAHDTLRAAAATEDNAPSASERPVPAVELLRSAGRPAGLLLSRLHQRHCVTRQEDDWSWRPGGRQEPADPERPEREPEQHPEPEVQRDRTATMSGTGSLLSASDLPSARSSAGHQLSFAAAATPVTTENLPIITEAQEQTPAAHPPAVLEPPPPPVEEQLLLPPAEEQPPPPPPSGEEQRPPPPPPPSGEEQLEPAAAPADSGAPGHSSSGGTASTEPIPPTQSPPLLYGPSSQFRSASLVSDDMVEVLRASPSGRLLLSELAPPGRCTRQQAAATFVHLLQLHARGAVTLQQTRPYGDISILPRH